MAPCSCAPRDVSKTAKSTGTGAWWRTAATATGVWFSAKCCIWVRSTTASGRRGAGPSRCCRGSRDRHQWRFFPMIAKRQNLTCETVRIHVKDLSVHRPRQWGACWLALTLWDRLELDRFWAPRLSPSRQGTRWLDVLKTQVCYQLLEPGSEWRLHRHWYEHSALGDLAEQPGEGHRWRHAVSLPGQGAGAQASIFLVSARTLGDACSRPVSTSCSMT